MGQGTWVRRLKGPLHHLLQIGQQLATVGTDRTRRNVGLPAHRWQRRAPGRTCEPVTKQVTGLMQKILEPRIERLRGGKRIQLVRQGQQRRTGVQQPGPD